MHTRRLALDVAPWALFRALARKERPFYVDAAQSWGDEWTSSMGFRPRMQFRIAADDRAARAPLDALDAALAEIAIPYGAHSRERPVPFAGGAVVALAYETKNTIETSPHARPEEVGAPHLVCAIYDAVIAYDHRRQTYFVATWHLDDGALAHYAEEVRDAAADAAREARSRTDSGRTPRTATAPVITSNCDPDEYASRFERVRAYIAAGDVYQVNLSQRFRAPLPRSTLGLYENLRRIQPVPFGRYLDLGEEQILSNSPELFLRRRGDEVSTCPIKGTRRRGATDAEDGRLVAELRTDPKEQAEHVMIVDLERNDLGRVCRTGSIRVTRFAEVASFRTVHHLVSTVTGIAPAAVTAGELLRATFPGGSITGAPKIRAMQIIDELEREPRGFYTGALGWIDASGDLDLNVAIRTAVVAGNTVSYHAGGGIVADSEPAREYAETLLKAQAFFRALDSSARPAESVRREWCDEHGRRAS